MPKDGRKTQSAKGGNRTPHDTGNRSTPSTAGSTPSTVTKTEWQFSRRKIEEWHREKKPGNLQLEEPMYYSTTSGFDTNGEVKTRELVNGSNTANRKSLNADMIQSRLSKPLNLEEGKTTVENYRSGEKLNILLEGLIRHKVVGSSKFVCQRGLLIQVGLTPLCCRQRDEGLTIAVEKIAPTIYMYLFDSEKPRDDQQDTKQRIGIRFEQHLTDNLDENFDKSLEFCALVKAKLGDHELIISGEVDCVDRNGDLVELKTSMHDIESLPYMTKAKWWLQCNLLDIKTIVVGKHDDRHQCTGVRRLPVPSSVTPTTPQSLTDWLDRPTSSATMLAAIHKFLTMVDEEMKCISSTGPQNRKIYLFKTEPRSSSFDMIKSTKVSDQFMKDTTIYKMLHGTPPASSVSSPSAN